MGYVRQFGEMGQMAMTCAKQPAKDPKRVNAKLTDEQVLETLELHDKRGWSAGKIARKLGIMESQAQGIINGNGTRTVALRNRST